MAEPSAERYFDLPAADQAELLRLDYQAMLSAQMFYWETMSFDDIVARPKALEDSINNRSVA